MELLLLTKDNRILFNSTLQSAIADDSLEITDDWKNMIIRLKEGHKANSDIKVKVGTNWGLKYVNL